MCFHLNKQGWLSQLHRMLGSHVGWRCISRKYIRIHVYSWLDEGGKYHSVVGVYFYELLTDLNPGPCLWEFRVCTWTESIFLASTRALFNWIIVDRFFSSQFSGLTFGIPQWNHIIHPHSEAGQSSQTGNPGGLPLGIQGSRTYLSKRKYQVCFSYSRLPPSGKS